MANGHSIIHGEHTFTEWGFQWLISRIPLYQGSRLILHLREAAREDFLPGLTTFPEDEQTAHDPISFLRDADERFTWTSVSYHA